MTDISPTDRELEALKVLWDLQEATVRQICDAICETGEDLAYTTVLSLLQVMEQKGLVGHRKQGKAYVYYPLIEREQTLGEMATEFLERVFDGSLDQYLVHALGSRKLSRKDLDQLEEMIEQARKKKSNSPTRKKRD